MQYSTSTESEISGVMSETTPDIIKIKLISNWTPNKVHLKVQSAIPKIRDLLLKPSDRLR